MGETHGPVRRSGGPRPSAATPATPPTGDLQEVFLALARRAKLPTSPDATPDSVLCAAGLPLLMATVVAGTPAPGTETDAVPAPTARQTGKPAKQTPTTPAKTPRRPAKSPAKAPAAAKAGKGAPEDRAYPPAVTAAADANRKSLAKRAVPSRTRAKKMVIATAREHDVDPALALAVAFQESGFNQRMVSRANAIGVMQLIPSAGTWASGAVGRPLNLLDTQDNITAGVVLLAALGQVTSSQAQALAGYYQGLASTRTDGVFDDTRRYVATVQTLRSRFARTL